MEIKENKYTRLASRVPIPETDIGKKDKILAMEIKIETVKKETDRSNENVTI